MTMVINSNGTSIDYDAAVALMDDDLREEVAADLAPAQSRSFSPSIASGTPSNSAHHGSLIKATPHTNTIFHPAPRWRGFSFALHLLRVQGFYFALLQCSHIQAFTARFVPLMQFMPPTQKNSAQGFTAALL